MLFRSPGVDDGATDIEETRKLLRMEYKQGVRNIIATPHFRFRMFETPVEKVKEQFKLVEKAAAEISPDLHVYLGQPGKFSKSLIHSLSVIDNSQAKVFCNISRYCMHEKNSENIHPIIFIASNVDTYKALGIDFESLVELENLGLLQCNFEKEFIFTGRKYLVYGNRVIEIYGTQKSKKKIKVGNVLFTRNGLALYEIVDPIYKEFDNNILEFIVDKLIKRKCEIIINNKRID